MLTRKVNIERPGIVVFATSSVEILWKLHVHQLWHVCWRFQKWAKLIFQYGKLIYCNFRSEESDDIHKQPHLYITSLHFLHYVICSLVCWIVILDVFLKPFERQHHGVHDFQCHPNHLIMTDTYLYIQLFFCSSHSELQERACFWLVWDNKQFAHIWLENRLHFHANEWHIRAVSAIQFV